jgi:hypothetical protein
MWYDDCLIDFPMAELLNDSICLLWLARSLHPNGWVCPRCGHSQRRLCRDQGCFPASRCRACEGDSTRLTGTVCAHPRQRPATLGLWWRGMATGEPTARLARELALARKPLHTLRQRLHTHLNDTAPTTVMTGTALEADELDQHAGEPQHTPSRSHGSPPSTRASAPGAWPLCQRPSPDHQPALAGHRRAARVGV